MRPDQALTPGAVASTDRAEVCAGAGPGSEYSRRHRKTTEADRRADFARYAIPWARHIEMEVDHCMPDRLSPEERSAHMRRIRKADTTPERTVRSVVHGLGFRFRLHRRGLPGTPDLVLPRLRKAILVHGCFWHQHPGCRLARLPKSRPEYWLPKLKRNQDRDAAARAELEAMGWEILVVWECETEELPVLKRRLSLFLACRPSP